MPNFAGINFKIQASSQLQYSKVIYWLEQATRGIDVQSFLAPLAGRSIYITAPVNSGTGARYKGSEYLNDGQEDIQFYNLNQDGTLSLTTDGVPIGAAVENLEIDGGLANTSVDNQPVLSNFLTPDGFSSLDVPRILFHELAHAVTVPEGQLASNFGEDETPYAGVESLAITAENLIYIRDNGGAVRIGHTGFKGARSITSYDPTTPFVNATAIAYSTEQETGGGAAGVFTAAMTDAGTIRKVYGSTIQNPYNFVTITGERQGLVGDGSDLSTTFLASLSGMMTSSERVITDLADIKAVADDMLSSIPVERLTTLITSSPVLSQWLGFSLSNVTALIGLSNERFEDGHSFEYNYVGPVLSSNNREALGFIASQSGIVVGGSGFSVEDPNRVTPQSLAATDKITAYQSGSSVLIAGEGPRDPASGALVAGSKNQLIGGNDTDVFVGGSGDDEIYSDAGSDIVLQSLGSDVVHGNGRTIFAVDRSLSSPVIDTRAMSGNNVDIQDGNFPSDTTVLENVRAFLGNQNLTTFLGNSSAPSLFIAGSGGGDFTLEKGDVAIGNGDAPNGNIYRVSSGEIGDITIVGFGPRDSLYVDGVLFTGVDETITRLNSAEEAGGQDGADQVIGQSAVKITAPAFHKVIDSTHPNFYNYEQSSGEYADAAYIQDNNNPDNGTLHIFDQNVTIGQSSLTVSTKTDLAIHIYGQQSGLPSIQFKYHYNNWDSSAAAPFHNAGAGHFIPSFTSDNEASPSLRSDENFLNDMINKIIAFDPNAVIPSPAEPPSDPSGPPPDHGQSAAGVFYYFRADGDQTVTDVASSLSLVDLLRQDVEIFLNPANGNDVFIKVLSSGSVIKLVNGYVDDAADTHTGASSLIFSDGSSLSLEQIRHVAWLRAGDGGANIDGFGGRDNTFVAGPGIDHFRGHDGNDTYIYTSAAGNLDLEDYSYSTTSVDTLKLTDLNAADVTFYADQSQGNDVYIRVNATGNVIRLERQFESGDDTPNWGLEQVVFADGKTMDRQQIRAAAWFRPGAGSQSVDGYWWDNTFVAGTGNDHVSGHDGNDTYIYSSTAGNLDLEDYSYSSTSIDTLKLIDLNASDVTFYADRSQGDDVYIRINATGNTIRLDRQNKSGNNGPDWGLEQVVFADGTTMDRQQIRDAAWYRPGAGDVRVEGYGWNNTFVAGTGNDHLVGYDGSDTYIYVKADGSADIEDYSYSSTSIDTLKLIDLNASDVTFYADRSQGDDVYIRINATGNTIRLDRQNKSGNNGPDWGVEQVVFADGTTMDRQQIRDAAWYRPGVGDVRVDGYGWNNTFVAGTGNDHLVGYDGSDTYIYANAAGNADIEDFSHSSTSIDTLKLTDLNASAVVFSVIGSDALLTAKSTGRVIRLDRQMEHDGSSPGWGIDLVQFADGSIWDRARLMTELTAQQGSDGDDHITVASGGEVYGNGGDDTIIGSGIGTAAYSGKSETYSVTKNASGDYVVYDGVHGRDGVDDIWDLDTLQFKDVRVRFADRLEGWIGNVPTLSEKAPAGTVVGTVAAYRGALLGEDIVYSLDADSLGNFAIDPRTGVVTVAHGATLNAEKYPVESLKVSVDFGDFNRVIPLSITMSSLLSVDALGIQQAPILAVYGSTTNLGVADYQLTPDAGGQSGNMVGMVDLSSDVIWTTRMYFGSHADGADGVSFALSGLNEGPQDGGGGSLGTLNPNTFGFKVDTYTNSDNGDPNGDFSQFILDGNVFASSVVFDNYHLLGNVEDGNWRDVTITWQAATHTLGYSMNGTLIEQKTYDVVGNILSGSTQAYFNFGASTGGATNDQRVQILSVAQENAELSVDVGAASGTLVAVLRPSGVNSSHVTYQIVNQGGAAVTDALFRIDGGGNIEVKDGATLDNDGSGEHDLFVKATDSSGNTITSALAIKLRTVGSSYSVDASADLTGEAGSDLFSIHAGFGAATIENFDTNSGSHDVLVLSRNLFSDWSHLLGATRQVGSDIVLAITNHDSLILKDVALASFKPSDVHFI